MTSVVWIEPINTRVT